MPPAISEGMLREVRVVSEAEVFGGSLAQPARPSIAHPRVRAMILAGSRTAWGDGFGRDISG